VATPIGHTLIGMMLARRLGVRSPLGLVAAGLAANTPDFDVALGLALHRDPWRLHRQGTHTYGFALTAGALAGVAGIVGAGSDGGERDLIFDALTGAAVVGSHVLIDNVAWFPYVKGKKGMRVRRLFGVQLKNWAIDAVIYGVVAWKLWPREAENLELRT